MLILKCSSPPSRVKYSCGWHNMLSQYFTCSMQLNCGTLFVVKVTGLNSTEVVMTANSYLNPEIQFCSAPQHPNENKRRQPRKEILTKDTHTIMAYFIIVLEHTGSSQHQCSFYQKLPLATLIIILFGKLLQKQKPQTKAR